MAKRTRRGPADNIAHFRRELDAWVKKNFAGNHTHAANALGVSQGQISAIIAGTRGVGLNILLAYRDASGRSLDEMLGLSAPHADEILARLTMALETEVARIRRDANSKLEEARGLRVDAEKALRAEESPASRPRRGRPKKA